MGIFGYNSKVDVKGVGACKLTLHSGQILFLYDVLHAPEFRLNLVSIIILLNLGYS